MSSFLSAVHQCDLQIFKGGCIMPFLSAEKVHISAIESAGLLSYFLQEYVLSSNHSYNDLDIPITTYVYCLPSRKSGMSAYQSITSVASNSHNLLIDRWMVCAFIAVIKVEHLQRELFFSLYCIGEKSCSFYIPCIIRIHGYNARPRGTTILGAKAHDKPLFWYDLTNPSIKIALLKPQNFPTSFYWNSAQSHCWQLRGGITEQLRKKQNRLQQPEQESILFAPDPGCLQG